MLKTYYETERLELIVTNKTLVDSIIEYLMENKTFLEPYETVNIDLYKKRIVEKDTKKFNELTGLNLWIKKKNDHKLIGSVSLNSITLGDFSSADFGYRLDYRELRKGYMQEACCKCIDIAFNEIGIHRLVAMVMLTNIPSFRLAQKLGFAVEGIAQKYAKVNNRWEDHIQMVMINENIN